MLRRLAQQAVSNDEGLASNILAGPSSLKTQCCELLLGMKGCLK